MKRLILIAGLIFIWSIVSFSRAAEIISFSSMDSIEIVLSLIIELLCLVSIKDYFQFKSSKDIMLFCSFCCLISIISTNNLLMDIRCVLWWPCIYAYFYTLSRQGIIDELKLKYYFLLLFAVIAILYTYSKILNPISYVIQGQEFFYSSSFIIFYVITLLPIAFIQKQSVRYILIGVGIIAALYSFKRSVIIVSVLILCLSFMYDIKNKGRNIKQYLLLILAIFAFYFLAQRVDSNVSLHVLDRFNNIGEGGGSGRTDIYGQLMSNYFDQNPIYMIFGRGYNSVIKYQNIIDDGVIVSAHNDYLEYLFDFGIVGFVFYILFTINLFKHVNQCFDRSKKYYGAAIFVSFLTFSLISHLALYPTYICYLMIMIGIFEGSMDREKNNIYATRS